MVVEGDFNEILDFEMSSLLTYVVERLRAMCALVNLGLDAVTKSMRAYPTRAHPALLERLSHYASHMSNQLSVQGRTFAYQAESSAMSGSNVINFLLQSFYDQESRGREDDVIYLKVSSKTQEHDNPAHSVREAVIEWAQSMTSETAGYTNLADLIHHELGFTFRQELNNYGCSSLSNAIESHLRLKQGYFSPVDAVHVPGRQIKPYDLVMNTKYYETRDDNRAYCQDKNRLRSLVGCMLHRLICPKQKSMRRNLHSARVLRTDDKDILQLTVQTSPDEGVTTFLILGDISNFTGSLANSWLMLHCMARDIAGTSLKSRKSLFSVGGVLISARWLDVIVTYLYLTVGMPVWIEDEQRHDFLPGGYLGVAANITAGLLFLSFAMIYAMRSLTQICYDIQGQAGGDDHAFLVTCPAEHKDRVCLTIRYQMSNFVGFLKEYNVIDLDTMPPGILPDATFCRKRIMLRRTDTTISILGEPTFPLPVAILPHNTVPVSDRNRVWREVDSALQSYADRYGDPECIGDMIRSAYLRKYPRVRPVRYLTRRIWLGAQSLVRHEEYTLTQAAWQIVLEQVPVISTSDHTALISNRSRISHALKSDMIQAVVVEVDDETVLVCTSQQEKAQPLMRIEHYQEWRYPKNDFENELVNILT